MRLADPRVVARGQALSPLGRGGVCGGVFVFIVESESSCQIWVERPERRLGDVALLWRLLESRPCRRARLVRGGEIGAPVERIVRRRPQAGLRARPGRALLDA